MIRRIRRMQPRISRGRPSQVHVVMRATPTTPLNGGRARIAARAVIAVILAATAATVPVYRASACSCIPFGAPEEVLATQDLTFIGSVVDAAEGGVGPFGGRTTLYAFDVERASASTDAIVVVKADMSSTCGVSFGMGERWLVSAYRSGVDLETGLCSGNQLADDMEPAELATYVELLDSVPPDVTEAIADEVMPDLSLAVVVAVLALLGLVGVVVVAIRRSRRDDVT